MFLEKETFEKFKYKWKELGSTSTKICILKCDYCGLIFERTMREITRGNKNISLDACKSEECRKKKLKDVYQQSTIKNIHNINKKREETCLKEFGTHNVAKLKEKQQKAEQTRLEKYGVRHALQSQIVQEKRKNTLLNKYGTLSTLDISGRKSQIIDTLKSKALETVKKSQQTSTNRYGTTNPMENEKIAKKSHEILVNKHGKDFYSKISKLKENKLSYQDINEYCAKKNYIPLFNQKDYVNNRKTLTFKCSKHDLDFESCIFYIENAFNQCPSCRNYTTSKQEHQIKQYISSICNFEIISNDRIHLKGTELDIFIPQKNIAMEHHGLYWHSNIFKDKKLHQIKFQKCKEKNIKLLQFFEDEWRDKQEICKSIIKNKLKLCDNKFFARKLKIVESDVTNNHLFNDFFNNNHLQGNTRYVKSFGLVDKDNNLVFAISLRKPFIKKYNKTIEIARIATKTHTVVVGGFSKLMKKIIEWSKIQNYENILTYSDCRHSSGEVYQKYGFSFKGDASVDYYYTDFVARFNRFQFRAKNGKSEKEIAKESGVYKIYGAGNYRWELKI